MPEIAFALRVVPVSAGEAEAVFDIAPGYYLFRDHFHFSANPAVLRPPILPAGEPAFDETLQKDVEVHRGSLRIPLRWSGARSEPVTLTIDYQGCADQGLCYAPQRWRGELRREGTTLRVHALAPAQRPAVADSASGPPARAAAWPTLLVGVVAGTVACGLALVVLGFRRKKSSTHQR